MQNTDMHAEKDYIAGTVLYDSDYNHQNTFNCSFSCSLLFPWAKKGYCN